jgi:O-antigen ligase
MNRSNEGDPLPRWKRAAAAKTGAKLAFALALISLPLRGRVVLLARPLPPVYSDFTDFLIFPSDLFVAATLLLWLADCRLSPRSIARGPAFLFWPLTAITGIGLASAAFSVDPPLSLYHAIRLAALSALYLYAVNEVTSLRALLLPVAGQVSLQAVIGVGQVLQQHSLGLPALGELELDPAWQGVSVVSAEGARALRAYGLTDHPNILGGCLAFGLILIALSYEHVRLHWRALAGSVFGLGALALLLTFSRSAWLAMAAGAVLAAALLLKTRQLAALRDGLILAAAGLILVLPFAWHNAALLAVRFNRDDSFSNVIAEQRSFVERGLLSEAALRMLTDRPLTGVGLGTFPSAFRLREPDYPLDYQPPHLAILEASTEIGILGGLAYVVASTGPWIALMLNRRRLAWSTALIGASALLLAVSVVGLFDYYTWLTAPGRLWQWLAWGVWAAAYQSSLLDPARN